MNYSKRELRAIRAFAIMLLMVGLVCLAGAVWPGGPTDGSMAGLGLVDLALSLVLFVGARSHSRTPSGRSWPVHADAGEPA